ncbi:hypothetical protein CI238_11856 [Colletotrichum incanum]|uniref:Uncharacterized protein n=1 Tax=Colletotrichum incanum TaxID=1573173 RepID=A0A166MHX8_COLIC|nr:hypothetical protein CI238_11856 [Colletotrichum incanum]
MCILRIERSYVDKRQAEPFQFAEVGAVQESRGPRPVVQVPSCPLDTLWVDSSTVELLQIGEDDAGEGIGGTPSVRPNPFRYISAAQNVLQRYAQKQRTIARP